MAGKDGGRGALALAHLFYNQSFLKYKFQSIFVHGKGSLAASVFKLGWVGKLRSVHERPTWPPHSNSEKRTVEKKVHERPTWRRHSGGKAVLARAGKINRQLSLTPTRLDSSPQKYWWSYKFKYKYNFKEECKFKYEYKKKLIHRQLSHPTI